MTMKSGNCKQRFSPPFCLRCGKGWRLVIVDKYQPTLLADECDSWIHNSEDLSSLLNSGHKRGGQALRCVGDDFEPRAFNVFAPVVLAGIGGLPGTLHDRSIVTRMERAKPGEIAARFDSRRTQRETQLCRKVARWTADNFDTLRDCEPQLPETAFNRIADNWRPLLAIAEVAGGDWPKRASEAFAKLTSTDDVDAQGIGTTLLADLRPYSPPKGLTGSRQPNSPNHWLRLKAAPGGMGKAPKANFDKSARHPITSIWYLVRWYPHRRRNPARLLARLVSRAFERYLPKPPPPECNTATTLGDLPVSEVQHAIAMLRSENGPLQRECCTVALQKGIHAKKGTLTSGMLDRIGGGAPERRSCVCDANTDRTASRGRRPSPKAWQ